jgi:hypothetical protein
MMESLHTGHFSRPVKQEGWKDMDCFDSYNNDPEYAIAGTGME